MKRYVPHRYVVAVRWLWEKVAGAWQRRQTRREFARLRVELDELNRKVADLPWWSELPRDRER